MNHLQKLATIFTLLAAAITHSFDLGGYGENLTTFTFADTGFFTDKASMRFEGKAGTDDYAFEAHIILTAAYQPLDPIQGLKKNSKMRMLMFQMMDPYVAMLQSMTADMEADSSSMILDSLMSEIDTSALEELDFMNENTLRYLPYTSFYPKETFTLDRALIKLYFKYVDIYVGRQMVAWGTGYAFNPTDMWNQKNPLDVSAPKVGVNALRLEIPLGDLSNLNFVGVPGPDIKSSSAGIRWKTNIKGWDASLSFSRYMNADRRIIRYMNADRRILSLPEKLVGGADFTGQIGEVGVWSEAAVVNFKYTEMETYESDSTYLQLDAGVDYTFENGLYVMAEYYHNGLGETHHSRYQPFDIFYQYMGDMAGLAKNYLMLGTRRNLLDKYDVSLFILTNIDDASAVFLPSVDYYFSDDVSINIGANLAAGEKEYTEFGSLYHSVNTKVTAYF
jgi:hypothetical protein